MRALVPFVVAAVLLFAAATGDASLPGLTSWWPGDGNGTDVTGGHNATSTARSGSPTARGRPGFRPRRRDDLVRVDDNADLHPDAGSFTALAWDQDERPHGPRRRRDHPTLRMCRLCSFPTRDGDWDLRVFNHGLDEGFIRDTTGRTATPAGRSSSVPSTSTTATSTSSRSCATMPRARRGSLSTAQLDVELALNADPDGTISNLDDADPVTIGGGWGRRHDQSRSSRRVHRRHRRGPVVAQGHRRDRRPARDDVCSRRPSRRRRRPPPPPQAPSGSRSPSTTPLPVASAARA